MKKKHAVLPTQCGTVCGMASIGPRGQLVIPKDAREKLKLKEGNRFLVIEQDGKIVLVPESSVRGILNQITPYFK